MIAFRQIFGTRWIITFMIAAFLIPGCSDDNGTKPENEAPKIPPLTTFLMDFDDFPSANPKMLSRENWDWAALNVFFWQTLVTVGMIIPAAAFIESFNHEPERQPDGGWAWMYTFTTLGGVLHTATLHADVDNSGIQWAMYITNEGEYTDFLWYTGWCDLLLTEGNWTLNYEPDDPTQWIGIEWHRNTQDSTADIKYTNIIPDNPENGGYIFYGTTTDTINDAFYDIYHKVQEYHTDIKWNRTTYEGRVKDSSHFGDTDWHCWDGSLQNIQCP